MNKTKLESCPFCDGEAEVDWYHIFATKIKFWLIGCSKCSCELREKFDGKQQAIKVWNRRVSE